MTIGRRRSRRRAPSRASAAPDRGNRGRRRRGPRSAQPLPANRTTAVRKPSTSSSTLVGDHPSSGATRRATSKAAAADGVPRQQQRSGPPGQHVVQGPGHLVPGRVHRLGPRYGSPVTRGRPSSGSASIMAIDGAGLAPVAAHQVGETSFIDTQSPGRARLAQGRRASGPEQRDMLGRAALGAAARATAPPRRRCRPPCAGRW